MRAADSWSARPAVHGIPHESGLTREGNFTGERGSVRINAAQARRPESEQMKLFLLIAAVVALCAGWVHPLSLLAGVVLAAFWLKRVSVTIRN